MNAQGKAKELYTKKANLYQRIFLDWMQYPKGIEAFFGENASIYDENKKILDAGSGTGVLIKALFSILPEKQFKKIQFTAFDIAERMLYPLQMWMRENNVDNIRVFQADVLQLGRFERDRVYDFIMTAGMLEYIAKKDFPSAITLFRKILKKEGKFLLFISKKTLLNVFFIQLWWKANLYSRRELITLLQSGGFKQITFHHFPHQYRYLNRWGYIIEAT